MTSGSTTNPADQWPHLFRQPPSTHSSIPQAMFGPLSDSVVVSTTSTSPTNTSVQSGISSEATRVARSNRRRSRASRKAPTTLLNTDTTNFRAMVQQFTGIPSGPYSTTYRASTGSTAPINYSYEQIRQPTVTNANLLPFSHVVGHDQHDQYQHYQPQYQQSYGTSGATSDHNIFVHRFNSNSGAVAGNSSSMELGGDQHQGFFFEASHQMMLPRPTSSSTNNNINRNNSGSDGYFS